MAEQSTLRQLAPHYVAMLLLVFVILAIVRQVAGELSFWIEFGLIAVIVFAYRPAVRALGVAPPVWTDREEV
ncbi:MAG: hypothetical protein V5A55_07150 [Halovenus sp.]